MTRRLKPTTVYLEPAQLEALRALSRRTRVPAAVYVREGVEWVLARARRPKLPRSVWTDESGVEHDMGPVYPVLPVKR